MFRLKSKLDWFVLLVKIVLLAGLFLAGWFAMDFIRFLLT
jgi:hypothetical protein